MNLKRIKFLKGFCHDYKVSLVQSIADGKKIPNLTTIKSLFGVLEEVMEHLEQEQIPSAPVV